MPASHRSSYRLVLFFPLRICALEGTLIDVTSLTFIFLTIALRRSHARAERF